MFLALPALAHASALRHECAERHRALMATQSAAQADRIRRQKQLELHPDRGGDTAEASLLNACHDLRRRHGPIRVKTVDATFRERAGAPTAEISALLRHVPQNGLGELVPEGDLWMSLLVDRARGRPVQLHIKPDNLHVNYTALYGILDEVFLCALTDSDALPILQRLAADTDFRAHIRVRGTAVVDCPVETTRGRLRHCRYNIFDPRRSANHQCGQLRFARELSLPARPATDPPLAYRLRLWIRRGQRLAGCALVLAVVIGNRRRDRRKLHAE